MTDHKFKIDDICDAGGYLLSPSHVLDKVNARIEKLSAAMDLYRVQRDTIHNEFCDDPRCFKGLDSEIEKVLGDECGGKG